MSDEGLILYQKPDGMFGIYDDTYDITIHCESQEEQDRVIEFLNSKKKLGDGGIDDQS